LGTHSSTAATPQNVEGGVEADAAAVVESILCDAPSGPDSGACAVDDDAAAGRMASIQSKCIPDRSHSPKDSQLLRRTTAFPTTIEEEEEDEEDGGGGECDVGLPAPAAASCCFSAVPMVVRSSSDWFQSIRCKQDC
jgi:hypothetical protein